ncbi:MAG TPA: SRPBCC family protein [Cytophagaceae bacterium]|jgi:hypothetical protein
MKDRKLRTETILNGNLLQVFEFFSKAENLNLLTPSHLNFKITTPSPIIMKRGTLIDYRLVLYGIPFKWRTEISEFNAPNTFTDTQLKGPYTKWIHKHSFSEIDGKVLMIDEVTYRSPGWIFEPLIHSLFVKRNLEQIFAFRDQACKKLFV